MWPDVILTVVSIILAIPGMCLSVLTLIDRYTERRHKN
jgi:hypothetical protein